MFATFIKSCVFPYSRSLICRPNEVQTPRSTHNGHRCPNKCSRPLLNEAIGRRNEIGFSGDLPLQEASRRAQASLLARELVLVGPLAQMELIGSDFEHEVLHLEGDRHAVADAVAPDREHIALDFPALGGKRGHPGR